MQSDPKIIISNFKGICKGLEEHIFDIVPKKYNDNNNKNKELTDYVIRTHGMTVHKSVKDTKPMIYLIINTVKYPDYPYMYSYEARS